ncbi:MAG: serine/threonine protein kinase, partial [Acidobacteriota bacterium]|nr:serine/threonine protein kinase [Acidobacteriota bacterium]
MSLRPGSMLGPYQVVGPIGAGGMGEVYRARDTKLHRDVALKVLPDLFAAHPDRLARFEREAQVLAAFNHSHIAQIYGVVEADAPVSRSAIVMELVEGITLAERIARGPVPIGEALPIAMQIADALEAAHDRGIIHRDLKPANIKITPEASVKVLDFGLAKAVTESAASDLPESPTVTTAGTREGMILGTVAYMSPEQARGLSVDRRTDVWSFGCVLFEMLTGRAPFAGATLSDTVAAILEREPDWTRLPGATPHGVVRLLRRCLQKDLKQRLRDFGDLRLDIDEALAAAADPQPLTSRHAGRRVWLAALIVIVLVVLAVLAALRFGARTGVTAATRLSISVPGVITPQSAPAISPDGLQIAFVTTDASGQSMLWVRAFDSMDARVLPGT